MKMCQTVKHERDAMDLTDTFAELWISNIKINQHTSSTPIPETIALH